jgi:hypothetical protein
MNKKTLVVAGLVLMVFSGLMFSACSKSASSSPPKELTEEEKREQEGRQALSEKRAEYTKVPAKEQLAKEPYMKKKLIFYRYDKDKKGTEDEWLKNDFGTDKFGSSVYSEANKKLEFKYAKSPEEVGIIALMPECRSVEAGSYGGTAAYKEQCSLILVDPELAAVVYRTTFEGKLDSSKYIGKESSVTAKVEGMDIVDFLDSLKSKSSDSPSKSTKK